MLSLIRLQKIYESLDMEESVSLNRVIENNLFKFIDITDFRSIKQENFITDNLKLQNDSKLQASENQTMINNINKLDDENLTNNSKTESLTDDSKIENSTNNSKTENSTDDSKIENSTNSSKTESLTNYSKNIKQSLINNLNKLDDECLTKLELITQNKEQFKTTIDNIPIKKPSAYSSTELGLIGEKIVEQNFKNLGYNVINSSERHHTGDLNVIFDDFIILVEIKNKQTITKEDVDKFKYDIGYLETLDGKKVYGLFVSLKTFIIAGIDLPKIGITKTYVSVNEIMSDSFIKSYISTLELIHGLKKTPDIQCLETILKTNQNLIESETLKIKSQNEILNLCQKTKSELEEQNTMLKNILKGIIPEIKAENMAIVKLKKYVDGKKWSLKEAKQIIGTYATFKKKSDVIDFLANFNNID